ncbi:uncharacterized protein G2W53_032769 [Senna tora]|uniref:Uncharacterized protein n=1 Tax=Senna tora TaxID=362788 RepID=A0A834SWH7_9FABA|nr:uncharacterized protein G2W53_032769 [Senna tora]
MGETVKGTMDYSKLTINQVNRLLPKKQKLYTFQNST